MMKHGAALDGWIRWELTEGGNVVQAGEQHNLFLNQGLDLLAQYDLNTIGSYLCVGTGSTAPDVTQTALVVDLARTNSNPQAVPVGPAQVSAGRYRLTFEREFAEAVANGNLTEWGVSPMPSGNLAVRELFRDGNGTPIVLTKTNTQKLRITYYLDLILSPVTPTAGALNITNLGNFPGLFTLHYAGSASRPSDYLLAQIAMRAGGGDIYPYALGSTYSQTYAQSITPGGATGTTSYSTYTTGTFKRRVTVSWATAQGNGTYYGIGLSADPFGSNNVNGFGSYGFKLDGGASFVKDNLHSLSVDLFDFTWGRL